MSLITGVIHAITPGMVSKGHFAGSPFKTITLTTGSKLTAFDTSFVEGLEIGKEYTFPIETSGNYINIVGTVTPVVQTEVTSADSETGLPIHGTAVPAEQVLPPPKPESYSKYGYKETEEDYRARQVSIRKAVALKAAIEYVIATMGGTSKEQDVIETAKIFEAYLE